MDQQLDQGGLLVWQGPEEDKAAQPEDCGSMIGDTQLIVMNDSAGGQSVWMLMS